MLVFSTRLPLKDGITQEECLYLFIKWVIDAVEYDVSSHKDFDCDYGNQTFSIRHYMDESIEISACRLENRESTAVWINDCIFCVRMVISHF